MTLSTECRNLYLRINPREIFFLKFILEGYDGLAVLTTIDRPAGIVAVRYPDCNEREVFKVVGNLSIKLCQDRHKS